MRCKTKKIVDLAFTFYSSSPQAIKVGEGGVGRFWGSHAFQGEEIGVKNITELREDQVNLSYNNQNLPNPPALRG